MVSRLKEKWKHSRKNKIRILAVGLVAAGLLLAVAYTLWIQPLLEKDRYIYIESRVEKGDLVLGIMESGTITLEESTIEYELQLTEEEEEDSDSSEDSEEEEEETLHYLEIEEVYVAAGQRISEGDALFKLTEESVAAVQKRISSDLTEARIALTETESEYQLSLLSAESTYKISKLEGDSALSIYETTIQSLDASLAAYDGQVALLQAEIADLQEQLAEESLYDNLDTAYAAYVNAKELYEETQLYHVEAYTSNYNDFVTAQAAYEQAQEAIDSLNESIEEKQREIQELEKEKQKAGENLESDKRKAKQEYEQSLAAGENAQDILTYTSTTLEESLKEAEDKVKTAEENQALLEAFIGEDGIVYADGAGLVTAVNYEAGDELILAGTMVSYVKEDAYTISIDVLEEDIPYLTVGDTVEITLNAYEDQSYKGVIQEISSISADGQGTVISYPVLIHIEDDTSKLYGGMAADVTFVTDQVEEVLYVSRKAIVENEAGETCVYQKGTMGSYILTPVETGFTDGTSIEIVSGLEEGDVIYLASRISGGENALKETGETEEAGSGTASEPEEGSFPQMEGMPSGEGGFPSGSGEFPSQNMPSGGGFPGGNSMPSGGGNMPSGGGFPGQ